MLYKNYLAEVFKDNVCIIQGKGKNANLVFLDEDEQKLDQYENILKYYIERINTDSSLKKLRKIDLYKMALFIILGFSDKGSLVFPEIYEDFVVLKYMFSTKKRTVYIRNITTDILHMETLFKQHYEQGLNKAHSDAYHRCEYMGIEVENKRLRYKIIHYETLFFAIESDKKAEKLSDFICLGETDEDLKEKLKIELEKSRSNNK